MKITRDMLKAKGACATGYREFCEAFPENKYPAGVDYQEVLDKCAENDRDSHASWLLNAFGRTNDVKHIDGDLISDSSIYVCGRLEVTGKITCKKCIEAGLGIKAGEGIKAGKDYGIYAGLSCRLSMSNHRKITARRKPGNIMCGEWVDK